MTVCDYIEIHRVSGQVKLPKGSPGVNLDGDTGLYSGVAYASQLPWLQHDTIKNVSTGFSEYELCLLLRSASTAEHPVRFCV